MKRVILCPNPYRDNELTVAKRSRQLLEQIGFETVVCLPFSREGYGDQLGVPIRQLQQEIDAQKTYQQTAIREEGRVDVGEAGTQTFLFDEAVAADLMYVLEHVDCRACSNQEILTIILDEADAFFQGRKTAQEASRIMDSRAALFIAENS